MVIAIRPATPNCNHAVINGIVARLKNGAWEDVRELLSLTWDKECVLGTLTVLFAAGVVRRRTSLDQTMQYQWVAVAAQPADKTAERLTETRHLRFPAWKDQTDKGHKVRQLLIQGYSGGQTSSVAPKMDAAIGSEQWWNAEQCVRVPFIARDGTLLALFGGHIHATNGRITWDVLKADGSGEYDGDERSFPAGPQCLSTTEMIRALRSM